MSKRIQDDPSYLFTLRVPVSVQRPLPPLGSFVVCTPRYQTRMVVIHAFDANDTDSTGHSRINVEVRLNGKTIIHKGCTTWCGVSAGTSLDGIAAKELVLSLVAMKPGDTDEDYFGNYTPVQLDFAETYSDDLTMARLARYCDPETGECRSPKRRR